MPCKVNSIPSQSCSKLKLLRCTAVPRDLLMLQILCIIMHYHPAFLWFLCPKPLTISTNVRNTAFVRSPPPWVPRFRLVSPVWLGMSGIDPCLCFWLFNSLCPCNFVLFCLFSKESCCTTSPSVVVILFLVGVLPLAHLHTP